MIDLGCVRSVKYPELLSYWRQVAFFGSNNGLEAIIHLKNNIHDGQLIPDVLLMDINMRVIDGWQFLDEVALLKGRLIKIPAIYLISSSDWLWDKLRTLTYPVVEEFRSKPNFEIDLLNIFQVSRKQS